MNPERGATTKAMAQDSEYDEAWDDDEPTTEELIEMLKEALHEAETGQTRPAREVMRELREMLAAHGDAG